MIRDEELNRLIRYAQGMGLSVRFKPYVKGCTPAAEWSNDGTEIVVYMKSRCSKIEKILSLIHELGHHKAFVNANRTVDPKVDEVLGEEDVKKRGRKRILDMEVNDASHWEDIYNDTNCKFDLKKLYKQREFDIWCYEVYYETGRDATSQERKAKMGELRKKWNC